MVDKSIKKNLILSTMYQVLTMLVPLITAPYVSRVLGVDGMGIYSYTHSYVMYFMLIAALGTVSYGTREIARHRNNIEKRTQIFWEICILCILTSAATIAMWGITLSIPFFCLELCLIFPGFTLDWKSSNILSHKTLYLKY